MSDRQCGQCMQRQYWTSPVAGRQALFYWTSHLTDIQPSLSACLAHRKACIRSGFFEQTPKNVDSNLINHCNRRLRGGRMVRKRRMMRRLKKLLSVLAVCLWSLFVASAQQVTHITETYLLTLTLLSWSQIWTYFQFLLRLIPRSAKPPTIESYTHI